MFLCTGRAWVPTGALRVVGGRFSHPAWTRASAKVPLGWQACHSEKYGRSFYWHAATGRSQWQMPEEASPNLPSGWEAIYSEAHGMHYYWHRPSGQTQWQQPDASAAPDQKPENGADTRQGVAGGHGERRKDQLLKGWREILHEAQLGEELAGQQLALVKELLEYHPEAQKKIGAGIQGVKVDTAPDSQASRCFWVLRSDGSQEDFSARKCCQSIRASLR
ncbi:unnamed protein product [Effrenium voratum]|uniref:WW domain-containing protein n=1 Tax=Effrenium voratum TaxID=2562239 RepID=A0AA36N3Z0_9DINO|nr:unnamed protein product [Effrenium voratum]